MKALGINATITNIGSGHAFANCAILILLFSTAATFADEQSNLASYPTPAELMHRVVQNEIKAANDDGARLSFRGVKTTPKGSATKLYVETRQATADEVIAYDGKPLNQQQRQAEEARIERFINNPVELKKKCEQDHETTERTLRILRALPDAFLFEYAGGQAGSDAIGRVGARLLKFNFRPKTTYQPPSRLEEVLTGLQGFVLIDAEQYRLASIDATLFKDVAFGWGILGHLNRGGRFVIQQENIADDLWQASSITFDFTGKVLFMKTINIRSTEVFSDFHRIPTELTFIQTLEMMKHQGPLLATNWIAFNRASKEIIRQRNE